MRRNDVSGNSDTATAVLYNDECPVCRFEVEHYRAAAARTGAGLAFDSIRDAPDRWGIAEEDAARRLHVRTASGVVSGFDAFLAIWRTLPGWRWAARVAGLPGLRGGIGWLYDRVGAPVLYAMHRRRRAKARGDAACSPSSTSSTRPS